MCSSQEMFSDNTSPALKGTAHSLMGETGSLPAAHSRRPKQPGSHTSTQVQGYSPSLGCSAPSLFLPVLKTHFLCLLASLICPSLGVEEKYKRVFKI